MSATVISPRLACHQRITSSGVVNAFQTSSFGASNSRVIRIWSSAGSVTFAERLVVTVISFLLLELSENRVQPLEAVRPRLLVLSDPVVDRLERLAVQPVEAPPSVLADVDRSDLAQHAQVLRDLRLGQAELEDDLVHR